MDYYTGQIILWAGIKVPKDWALCDGKTLPIASYEPLYSIIGTTYGGDGRTTFGLPDLRSRVPIGQGQGTGLTTRVIGSSGGAESVTVAEATMPAHTHTMTVSSTEASTASPANAIPASVPANARFYFPAATGTTPTAMAAASVGNVGSGMAHPNVMPSIAIQYIICLNGLYPVKP